MRRGLRLQTLGVVLILACFVTALGATWLWFSSTRAWQAHLTRSYVTGVALYETLRLGGTAPPPEGVSVTSLTAENAVLASQGAFVRLPDIPAPAFVTNVSIKGGPGKGGPGRDPVSGGESLTLGGIVSNNLQYAVSELVSNEGQPAAQKFANVTRLLATYCSEPVLFARMGGQPWVRIDGRAVWGGCGLAPPRDMRLVAVLVAVVALAIFATLVRDTSAHFDRFARALNNHRRLGGPQSYEVQGPPEELRDIVQAVNSYLEHERAQLSKRATVLSGGVSHDLGTPATRLRLRAALIKEADLREKLEADIDSMTEMIESVLTYTRAELNEETPPRSLSLTSLVDALVADYQDLDRPVTLRAPERVTVEGGAIGLCSKPGTRNPARSAAHAGHRPTGIVETRNLEPDRKCAEIWSPCLGRTDRNAGPCHYRGRG